MTKINTQFYIGEAVHFLQAEQHLGVGAGASAVRGPKHGG